jgi:hypothetical protein
VTVALFPVGHVGSVPEVPAVVQRKAYCAVAAGAVRGRTTWPTVYAVLAANCAIAAQAVELTYQSAKRHTLTAPGRPFPASCPRQ